MKLIYTNGSAAETDIQSVGMAFWNGKCDWISVEIDRLRESVSKWTEKRMKITNVCCRLIMTIDNFSNGTKSGDYSSNPNKNICCNKLSLRLGLRTQSKWPLKPGALSLARWTNQSSRSTCLRFYRTHNQNSRRTKPKITENHALQNRPSTFKRLKAFRGKITKQVKDRKNKLNTEKNGD